MTFEFGLKEYSVFNRPKWKQLLLGAQLMFAKGINERHRCEMCLRNGKFTNIYLTTNPLMWTILIQVIHDIYERCIFED